MIWIIDEVETKPGMGEAFLTAYMSRYAPGAEARGLRLAHRMVEPAMWMRDASNRLLLIWEAPEVIALWEAKKQSRADPSVADWWEEADRYLISRRRSTQAPVEMLGTLSDV